MYQQQRPDTHDIAHFCSPWFPCKFSTQLVSALPAMNGRGSGPSTTGLSLNKENLPGFYLRRRSRIKPTTGYRVTHQCRVHVHQPWVRPIQFISYQLRGFQACRNNSIGWLWIELFLIRPLHSILPPAFKQA
jgi:hypothetical protein